MEMKEKRNETAGIGYSVIINLDKIAQRCFNFFFWGGRGQRDDKQHPSSFEQK